MAEVTYSLDINRTEATLAIFIQGATEREVERRGRNVAEDVRSNIRDRAINGGERLADSVGGQVFIDGPRDVSAVIASDLEEALWFEEGTGLHGPRGQYIFPRTHQFMVFVPTGQSVSVRARRVQGQEARHPFRDGLESGFRR